MSTLEFQDQLSKMRVSLHRFALSLTADRDDADDLLQDTCLKALSSREKFRENISFKSWLFTIMKNTFINRYRRQGVRHAVMGGMAYTAGTPSPGVGHESPERGLLSDEISKALASVPEAWRQPFLMHHHGYRYHEIAEHLRIPIGTVKSKIHFARKALQHQLSELRYA
ncbi:MAG: RNA polymerase sigma factor [Flavobacteriales bacterium]|nr:RNA polymerase sigma factor [Flavobacteriales bacterium]MCB9448561.1 RNA polymerase sigma factor [Flavobacteriales bacterium]